MRGFLRLVSTAFNPHHRENWDMALEIAMDEG
jgi:hypothetical protein